jgi:hypothetical protein
MGWAPRFAQRKDENQDDIVDALEKIGADVWVMHQPCDLLVGFRGRNVLLEVKRLKGGSKPTPAQVKWNKSWRGQRATVRTPEEAIAAVTGASNG